MIIYEFMREVLHRRPNDFNAFAADWFSNPKLKSHIDARIAKGNPPRDLGLDLNYGSIQFYYDLGSSKTFFDSREDFVNDLDPMTL